MIITIIIIIIITIINFIYLLLLLLLLLLILLFNTSTPQFFSPFSCLLASFLVEYAKSGPYSKKKVQPYSFHFEY